MKRKPLKYFTLESGEKYISLEEHERIVAGISKDPVEPITIREAINRYRSENNLLCKQMAAKLGIGEIHYSDLMRGKKDFTIKTIKILYKLGIPADNLLN